VGPGAAQSSDKYEKFQIGTEPIPSLELAIAKVSIVVLPLWRPAFNHSGHLCKVEIVSKNSYQFCSAVADLCTLVV